MRSAARSFNGLCRILRGLACLCVALVPSLGSAGEEPLKTTPGRVAIPGWASCGVGKGRRDERTEVPHRRTSSRWRGPVSGRCRVARRKRLDEGLHVRGRGRGASGLSRRVWMLASGSGTVGWDPSLFRSHPSGSLDRRPGCEFRQRARRLRENSGQWPIRSDWTPGDFPRGPCCALGRLHGGRRPSGGRRRSGARAECRSASGEATGRLGRSGGTRPDAPWN